MKEKIILAYSGGLDTSVTIKWLKEKYDYDMPTVVANIRKHQNASGIIHNEFAPKARSQHERSK